MAAHRFADIKCWEASREAGAIMVDKHNITGKPGVLFPDTTALVRAYETGCAGSRYDTENDGGVWCSIDRNEAIGLAKHGWDQGAAQLGRFDTSHLPLAYDSPVLNHDVAGMFPDVGAFLAGEPECMCYLEPRPQASGAVKIIFNAWISGTISQSWIMDRAQRVAKLVLAMVRADVPVEVVLLDPQRHMDGQLVTVEVPVFKPGWVLNLSQLAYWLGHTGAIRRILYGWTFTANKSHGHYADMEANTAIEHHAKHSRAIYIPIVRGHPYNLNEAEASWIAQAKGFAHS